jgi:hypothetical protein
MLVTITPSWGFIVTHAVAANREKYLIVHDVNGRLIRQVKIGFKIKSWFCWRSPEAFDYVILGTEDGKVFFAEAFYCEIREPIHRGTGSVLALTYMRDVGMTVAVLENGNMVYIPSDPSRDTN